MALNERIILLSRCIVRCRASEYPPEMGIVRVKAGPVSAFRHFLLSIVRVKDLLTSNMRRAFYRTSSEPVDSTPTIWLKPLRNFWRFSL